MGQLDLLDLDAWGLTAGVGYLEADLRLGTDSEMVLAGGLKRSLLLEM